MEGKKDKYVAVYFGPNEGGGQRMFYNAMSGIGVIQVSKEDIDGFMKDFEREKVGVINRIVIHEESMLATFRYMMDTFFRGKEYKVTDDPDDKDFADWLQEKSEEIYTP